jgi:hypothetical protein
MKNISYEINLWAVIALLAIASACSRTTSDLNPPPPSDVNDVSASLTASSQTPPSPPLNANDVSASPTVAGQTPSPPPLDVNDVSFLWPVPQTKADVDALISLADETSDGTILPDSVFKALMKKAKAVSVGNAAIRFPDPQFEDAKTWKVAGIRVNPTALGSNPQALGRAEVPGVRLIVQPVTIDADNEHVHVHDFAAHVVFNYILPPQPGQPIKPDKEAFGKIVDDLRQIKKSLGAGQNTTGAELNVHPGFKGDPAPLTAKLKAIIKNRLGTKHLDKNQLAAISFMGIPGGFEPWIFFKVGVDTGSGTLVSIPVSGVFTQPQPESQMLSFLPSIRGAFPMPLKPSTVTQVSTSLLFPTVPANRLDEPLFPSATDQFAQRCKLRDVADLVANPKITNTTTTDCVSCHTETTRRNLIPNLTSQPGTAFALPNGISGVASVVVPKDRWNLRNFGWGFNFDGDAKGFIATVSQRAANEAAESADYINKNYPPTTISGGDTQPK